MSICKHGNQSNNPCRFCMADQGGISQAPASSPRDLEAVRDAVAGEIREIVRTHRVAPHMGPWAKCGPLIKRQWKAVADRILALLAAIPPKGETPSEAAGLEATATRNVLETYCESLGLRKGMALWDLAYIVTDRLAHPPVTPIEKAAREGLEAAIALRDEKWWLKNIALYNALRQVWASLSGLPQEPDDCPMEIIDWDGPAVLLCPKGQDGDHAKWYDPRTQEPAPMDGGPIAPPPTTSGPAQEPAAGEGGAG